VPHRARYALRFVPGQPADGLRGHRQRTGERTADGLPIVQVVVPAGIPVGDTLAPGLTQRDVWVRRIVVHETGEAAAVAAVGPVRRLVGRIRAQVSGAPPDALARDVAPGPRRRPHDEAHRQEVIDLVPLLLDLRRAGHDAAAREIERQLGHLLDRIGVGVPDAAAADAGHVPARLALLDLPAAALAVIDPLRAPDAPWRTYLPPAEIARIQDAVTAGFLDAAGLGYRLAWRDPEHLSATDAAGHERVVGVTNLVRGLSDTGLYGDRLRARALVELGRGLTAALPAVRGRVAPDEPAVAVAWMLANAYARTGGDRAVATEFLALLDGLGADEAIQLSWGLSDVAASLLPHVWRRLATEVVREVLGSAGGRARAYPVRAAELVTGDRLRITPHDGPPRFVPVADLIRDLSVVAATVPVPALVAAAAVEVGGRLRSLAAGPPGAAERGAGPASPAPASAARGIGATATAGGRRDAMAVLAAVHRARSTPDAVRAAVERAFFELMLRERYWEAPTRATLPDGLSQPAAALFERLANRSWSADPRPTRWVGTVAGFDAGAPAGPMRDSAPDRLVASYRAYLRAERYAVEQAAERDRVGVQVDAMATDLRRPDLPPGRRPALVAQFRTAAGRLAMLDAGVPTARQRTDAARDDFERRLDALLAMHDGERRRVAAELAADPGDARVRALAGRQAALAEPLAAARHAHRAAQDAEAAAGRPAADTQRAEVARHLEEAARRVATADARLWTEWLAAVNRTGARPEWHGRADAAFDAAARQAHDNRLPPLHPAAPASTAARVADFFAALDRRIAGHLAVTFPETVGNLAGVPLPLRYVANAARVRAALDAIAPRLADGTASRADRDLYRALTVAGRTDGGILHLSLDDGGRIAYVRGDLVTAETVAVLVPAEGGFGAAAEAARRAGDLRNQVAEPARTAVVAWIDAPLAAGATRRVGPAVERAERVRALRVELAGYVPAGALATVVGVGYAGLTAAHAMHLGVHSHLRRCDLGRVDVARDQHDRGLGGH
jgi:hypothetical protein